MPVLIRTADGQQIVVEGTLGEVRDRLLANWATLVDFKDHVRDTDVVINTQQITVLSEHAPSTVVLDEAL